MSFDNLLVKRESGIAVLTIDRPQRLNALDASTLDEIGRAVLDFQQDDSSDDHGTGARAPVQRPIVDGDF